MLEKKRIKDERFTIVWVSEDNNVLSKYITEEEYKNMRDNKFDSNLYSEYKFKNQEKTWFMARNETHVENIKLITIYIIYEQHVNEILKQMKVSNKKYEKSDTVFVYKDSEDKTLFGVKEVLYRIIENYFGIKRIDNIANRWLVFETNSAEGTLDRLVFGLHYKCKLCGEIFKDRKKRKEHLKEDHFREKIRNDKP